MAGTQDKAEQIRELAYILWEKAGRPSGHEHEFWAKASAEIASEERAEPEHRSDNRFVAR